MEYGLKTLLPQDQGQQVYTPMPAVCTSCAALAQLHGKWHCFVNDGSSGNSTPVFNKPIADVTFTAIAGDPTAVQAEAMMFMPNEWLFNKDGKNFDRITLRESFVGATCVYGACEMQVWSSADGAESYTPYLGIDSADRFYSVGCGMGFFMCERFGTPHVK